MAIDEYIGSVKHNIRVCEAQYFCPKPSLAFSVSNVDTKLACKFSSYVNLTKWETQIQNSCNRT